MAEYNLSQYIEDSRRRLAVFQDRIKTWCNDRSDAATGEMLADPERIGVYLGSSDAKQRQAALVVFTFFPHERLRHISKIESMMSEDPDVDVRICAVATWNCCYRGTNDSRVKAQLAKFVANESEPLAFRQRAYLGIFVVEGAPFRNWPQACAPEEFTKVIDWGLVNECLRD